MSASETAPHLRDCEVYGRGVTAARTPWQQYLADAERRAGSVAELARRAGVSTSTIFRWMSGETSAGRATVDNVTAIAKAVGDDPRNALRAAGQLPAGTPAESVAPATAPTLASRIRQIREQIQRVSQMGLDIGEESRALDELYGVLADEIDRYGRDAGDGPASGDARHIA